jgi:hypothetical protein
MRMKIISRERAVTLVRYDLAESLTKLSGTLNFSKWHNHVLLHVQCKMET